MDTLINSNANNEPSDQSNSFTKSLTELNERFKNGRATEDELLELATLYINEDQFNEAINVLKPLLDLAPKNQYALALLCDVMLLHPCADDYYPDVHRMATLLIQLGGEMSAAGYKSIEWALHQKLWPNHDEEESLRLLLTAVDIAPDWPVLQFNLAWAYNRLGQYDEADVAIRRAIEAPIRETKGFPEWKQYIENMVTGRASGRSFYQSERARMAEERPSKPE